DGRGDGVAPVDLPEARGAAPVLLLVVVVKGPDAVARNVEDLAADDVVAKAQDEIDIEPAHPGDVRWQKILGPAPAPHAPADELRYARKLVAHVDGTGGRGSDEQPTVERKQEEL